MSAKTTVILGGGFGAIAAANSLLRLLPPLADRWGVMSAAGVLLPAFLTHSVLAAMLGVRRPSFTTAAHRLAETGAVQRQDDGRWLVDAALCLDDPPAS